MNYQDAKNLLQNLNENDIAGAIFFDALFIVRKGGFEYLYDKGLNSYAILLEDMREIALVEEGLQLIWQKEIDEQQKLENSENKFVANSVTQDLTEN